MHGEVEKAILRHEGKEVCRLRRQRGGWRQIHQSSGQVGGIRTRWSAAAVEGVVQQRHRAEGRRF